jgi:hypothetical protein
MTVKEIREDLREIRYYYGMSDLFKAGSKLIPPQAIVDKVEKYNKAISTAPAKLYALYVGLYVHNNTQAVLAEDWGFTDEYIKQLNNKLCDFLKKYFETHSN